MQRLITFILLLASATPSYANDVCDALTTLSLADVAITEASLVQQPAPHCYAKGKIGTNIGFSLWLPVEWNGRFVMGGAGGFVRVEDNQALTFGGDWVLTEGYATASTDTGHQGDGRNNDWGLYDYEAIVNYAYLAMHRAVVSAKAVITEHYGKPAEKSFFVGCSNGGRQALHEAQRYPGDFDAIVAGAPALNFTGVTAAFLNVTQHMYPDPYALQTPVVSRQDRALLRHAIEAQCDAQDGVTDGVLQDPTACQFDVTTLSCDTGQEQNCLSGEKITAIQSVYQGPSDSDGPFFFGFPFGAENVDENGWGMWLTGGAESGPPNAAYGFGMGIMRNFVLQDANWTYANYDWDQFRSTTYPMTHLLDANDPDLSEFRNRGGKLLLFHGWADVALSAHMSTDYVQRVYQHDNAAKEDVRLFMMPGVLHCAGGPGPSMVNWLETIEQWHDTGEAPDTLVANYLPGQERKGARTICAWPKKAHYQGGDANTPEAYSCR